MPSAAPPVGVSPGYLGHNIHAMKVASVDVLLRWCRMTIDSIETYMADASSADRTQICEHVSELAENVKQGEHVKAMGDHLSPGMYGGDGRVEIPAIKRASALRAHAMLRPRSDWIT